MLKRPVSISLRLTLLFGGIFLFGWLLFGGAMWMVLKSTLKGERYQTLDRRLDRLQQLLDDRQEENTSDQQQDFRDFAQATGNGLSEIFRPDGTRAYPSPSAAAMAFPWPKTQPDSQQFLNVDYDGRSYWVLSRPVSLSGQSLLLLAAAPETSNQLVLHNFLRGLLASAPILLLISCAGGYWVSRRALQPVDRITAKARSISISNLSERLPVTQTADELQRLTVTCNAMLDRLESSVNRIKQFTADASHELRGPLSFTRTVAEVALRTPEIDANSRRAFSDIVDEAAKASVLLDEMLLLARADSDNYDMAQDTVDLADVVRDVYAKAIPIATAREVSLTAVLPEDQGVEVRGDFAHLRRLVWILLDNALKYTPASGRVEVSLARQNGAAAVHVRDTGVGIADEDLPHIFERFYRADPSRGMVEGNGLGLSIARWIAEMHHAEITVQSVLRTGTAFCVRFP